MRVFGEAVLTQFAKKHSASRKPLLRFLEIARSAEWPHFPAVKKTFASVDYAAATRTLILNVGGNKYRLVAKVDFEEQMLLIDSVLTHGEYDREEF